MSVSHIRLSKNADKIQRTGSTESMDNFDEYEENILSSLFHGIPMGLALLTPHIQSQNILPTMETVTNTDTESSSSESDIDTPKLKCVNVPRTDSYSNNQSSIVMKTGFRSPDEKRVIFKARPLGIQIKPLNIHGFGAKISKVSNTEVQRLGIRQNMIITGLNNKDLLGCTFDQIMNIIRNASLPITLRLKSMHSAVTNNAMAKPQKNTHRKLQKTMIKPMKNKNKTHKRTNHSTSDIPTPTQTALMLQSFSAENMPISTVLTSSSDEEPSIMECPNIEDRQSDSIEELKDETDEISYVNWNNIRLGASVIKYGWGLKVSTNDCDDDTTFELAYDALTRQGLNIYEIRAAIRLIREQPEQIPALETFNTLAINNTHNRIIDSSINPKFMPQQWLKEMNLNNDTDSDSESVSVSVQSLSEGQRTESLENELPKITLPQNGSVNTNISSEYKYTPKQQIKGYIDFFDDNDSSESELSESDSISKSIKVEQMFDIIGLKSPPIENILGLETEMSNINNNERLTNNNIQKMLRMDTPIGMHDFEDANLDLFNIISESENSEYESSEYESDINENGIGISSYICTEGADMIDNECLPQVMLKYVPKCVSSCEDTMSDILMDNHSNHSSVGLHGNNHRFAKVKNIMKNLKNLMRDNEETLSSSNGYNSNGNGNGNRIGLLTIKTKAKSIFNKISTPKPDFNNSKSDPFV